MSKPLAIPKHPGGRPSKYKPEYCELVLADMAQGFSLTAFAGLIGTNRQTLLNWQEAHPEFLDAVTRGKALQLRAWEMDARNIARGNGGPGASTMVVFGLCNLGGGEWRNKHEPDAQDNLTGRTFTITIGNAREEADQGRLLPPCIDVSPESQNN